ncbi:MAG: type II toxin-antitoxin system HicA family toxin [Gemmataceae bacterium]|nr:type II toxin-antitoxin system HicA family toxin [Gemmataceae bacterium]
MNRRDLERHLRANGCELLRHGSKHDVWWNPSNGRRSTVPRHAVIKPVRFVRSAISWKFRRLERRYDLQFKNVRRSRLTVTSPATRSAR